MRRRVTILIAILLSACGAARAGGPGHGGSGRGGAGEVQRDHARATLAPARRIVTLSIVGTNDFHGHIARLPVLSGYLRNLRRARAADGGAVLLVDAGDMFQGTLESNLVEGASVVRAYDALGYLAASVGNHDFDYGPVGPAATPSSPQDDPRGALEARAAQAHYPFLTANIVERRTGARVRWGPNLPPTLLVDRAGVRVGLIGVATIDVLTTTLAANVSDLAVRPLAETIEAYATRLREQGAQVIVVAAHAGGECGDFSDPDDLASCDGGEVFQVAEALPAGLVDVIVAGHTHHGVAHRDHGVAIIESYAYGVAFGRVDLRVQLPEGRILDARIHSPTRVCGEPPAPLARCRPGAYEGAPVEPIEAVSRIVERDMRAARAQRRRSLGVRLVRRFAAPRDRECALGNLFTDMMRRARPGADVALMNGGGLRAPLESGELTYGALYETFPFDNRFARVTLTGAQLATLIRDNLTSDSGIYSLSGIRARARCRHGRLDVVLRREDGRRVRSDERLTLLTSDYLATTRDRTFRAARDAGAVTIEEGEPIREALVALFEARGGSLDAADPALLDPAHHRLSFEGARPLRCD